MTVDLTQFHDAFFEESFEALDSMEAALLKLDLGSPEPELINTIFRVAHSIKGGSATFGFSEIASFTHSLETLLDELRSGTMAVTVALSDLLLRSVDVMRAMLRAVQAKQPIDSQRVSDLQFDLEVAIAKKSDPDPAAATPVSAESKRIDAATDDGAPSPASPRWRIHFHPYRELLARGNDPLRMLRELAALGELAMRVDAQMLPPLADVNPRDCYLAWSLELPGEVPEEAIRQVFEWAEGDCDLTIERPTGAPRELPASAEPATPALAAATPTPTAAATAPASATTAALAAAPPAAPASGLGDSGSIRVSVEKIDELMNTVGELVITQAMLSQLGSHFDGPEAEKLRGGLAQLERNMRELQESVMRVRMLPISFVFSRFPRMVRDLAQRLGKQIELKLTGEQTELDKTVLEKIGDPLVHLVRNCIDHGIESPEARVAAGKTAEGTVHLDAYHRGGNIAVEVSDDGGGLDKDRILAKARARGLVGPSDVLTDSEVYELIFVPGFSTAEKTTDLSGRGVGMDVVRRNVKELGGKVDVKSDPGRGSRFTITLPLTLAIVDGQSVAVGTETYIVPLISIVESMQLKATGVTRLSGRSEVLSFRGDYLPIVRLHELFGVEPRSCALHEGLVVVAEGDGRRVGLFVDDLLGQQQVVIKSLEANYGHIEGVSGATILGDGSVALILDVPGLIRAASMRAAA
ncbi:MAG TPA: chemotaxis protein CheA [Steroidobacteraceae bacterium]|jgi:two-component system chemotaxis sensor kinase CheA